MAENSNWNLLKAIAAKAAADTIADAVSPIGGGDAEDKPKRPGILGALLEQVVTEVVEPVGEIEGEKPNAFGIGLQEAVVKNKAQAGARLGLLGGALLTNILSELTSPLEDIALTEEELAARQKTRDAHKETAKRAAGVVGSGLSKGAKVAGRGARGVGRGIAVISDALAARRAAKRAGKDTRVVIYDDSSGEFNEDNVVDAEWTEL